MKASLELFRSARLKKIFEVILAFGNYMNSTLKGVSKGFKLESLDKVSRFLTSLQNIALASYWLCNILQRKCLFILYF